MAFIRVYFVDGKRNWLRIPKEHSSNGNKYKDQAKIADLERLLGQAHAEIELLKKAFAMTQKKIREERLKPMLRDDI